MSDPTLPPPPGPRRPPLRWWPGGITAALTAILIAVYRLVLDVPFQTRNLLTAVTLVVASLVLGIWWLFLSRAPVRLRLLSLVAGCLVLGGLASLFRVRGVSGDLVPILEPRWSRQASAPPVAAPPPAPQPAAPAAAPPAMPAATPAPTADLDFPQFQGPRRDAVLDGPALARDWTARPPHVLWRQPIGPAWSGFAIAGPRAITQEQRGEEELVTCYDLATGRRWWEHADPARYATTIAGEGPRCTPTVVGDRVYTLGATGWLNCLDVATGRPRWRRDLRQDAGVKVPEWGFASSPLVVDGRVIVSAGGAEGRSLLAYRAEDGEIAWTGGSRPVNYSSPTLVTLLGRPQVLMFNSQYITAHAPETGAVLWEYPWGRGQPHVALPVPVGANQIVFSSGYGVGAELLELETAADGRLVPRQVWKSIRLKAKFSNFFEYQGSLFGLDDGILACLDARDGSLRWKEGRYGHGQMLRVGDLILLMAEGGELVLLEPSPEGRRELGRFRVFPGKTWNPPALAGTWLLVRNDLEVACLRLPADPKS